MADDRTECEDSRMKVRIGFGLGTQTRANEPGPFGELVDALEALRYDSLWLSERLTGDAPDPLIALAFAAARTTRLKLGTAVLVLPGRNPVILAKELATLDRLSGGRLLPAVGLGAPVPVEHRAFGVDRKERAGWFDEAIALMRALWTGDEVTHDGARFAVDGVRLRPRPVQQPIELWLGGRMPSELRRTGRLGDGWLPSFTTPSDVAEGWELVTATATEHGRAIDPEHLGVLIPYAERELPELMAQFLAKQRPDLPVDSIVPVGPDALRRSIEDFIAVGASKFVVTPLDDVGADGTLDWPARLVRIDEAVRDLEN